MTGSAADGLTTDEREELRRLRRENKTLREEREILKKAAAWFAKETGSIPSQGFEFVKAHRPTHRLATMCRVLGVSPSGYYAWRRGRCRRAPGPMSTLTPADRQAIHTRRAAPTGRPACTPNWRPQGTASAASASPGSCARPACRA